MSLKSKGIDAERELIHKFWAAEGWAAIRIAGSGSSRYPSTDILAGNRARKLAVECKSTKSSLIYLPKEEISQLKIFGDRFGAELWIGARFNNNPWYFMSLDDLKETDKNFAISLEQAKNKGLLFEELIEA